MYTSYSGGLETSAGAGGGGGGGETKLIVNSHRYHTNIVLCVCKSGYDCIYSSQCILIKRFGYNYLPLLILYFLLLFLL